MRRTTLTAAFALCVASPTIMADKWVDDWFDSATYSGSSTFSTQNRNFMSGGSFSVRSQVKTDYPVTISMPKVSAGCGGIDGFMGGFSFLDADYLVDKTQRMMQAAPYIAVDMALKTMSKEFSDSTKAAEDVINALNSIQLNECSSMKPVVTAAIDQNPEAMKAALGEIVNAKQVRDSTARLWQETTENLADNDNNAPVDISSEMEGCPSDVKEIFAGGSVIEKVANRSSMGDHADLMRGFFGDVVIKKTNNLIVAEPILPCPENRDNHEGFLYGDAYERDESTMACNRVGGKTVHETIYEKITAIADKISGNQTLSSDDKKFAGQGTQLPIFKMLQVAHEQGTLTETVQVLTDVTAAAYAARVSDTFYYETYGVLKRISDAAQNPTQANNNKPCNMTLFAGAAAEIRDILREVRDTRRNMMATVQVAINEHTQFQSIVDESRRRLREIKANESERLGGGY